MDQLHAGILRWASDAHIVVADTSVYVHAAKLEELEIAGLADVHDSATRLVMPMTVVDELDSLKMSKDKQQRWRGRYTLAVVDELLSDPAARGKLPYGSTVELLPDPPGHVRLPIADDEIVERALAVKALAGRQITLVTYDTGQSTRGRAADLRVVKIPMLPEGDEPKAASENR